MGSKQETTILEPRLKELYYQIAVKQVKERNLSQAIIYLEKANSLLDIQDGEVYEYYNLLGLCYYQLGEWHRAKKCWNYSKIVQSQEDNRAYHYLKHLELEETQNYMNIYKQVLQYVQDYNYKKAEKLLRQYLTDGIETVNAWQVLGLCQYKMGRYKQALVSFKKALEKDSSNSNTLRYIKGMHIKANRSWIRRLTWKIIMKY